jgi:hypothetical protein
MSVQSSHNSKGISENIQISWHGDQQVVAYKLLSGDTSTIQEWGNITARTILDWDCAKPYLALHDISYPGVAMRYSSRYKNILTPAITEEGMGLIQHLLADPKPFVARIAVLVSVQFSGHITQTFARLEERRLKEDRIQFKIVTDHTKALNWLLSGDK